MVEEEGGKGGGTGKGENLDRLLQTTAIGEITEPRPLWLVLLVLPVGIFLAIAPFLFMFEKNDLDEILKIYDKACEAKNLHDIHEFVRYINPQDKNISENDSSLFSRIRCVDRHRAQYELRTKDNLWELLIITEQHDQIIIYFIRYQDKWFIDL